MAYYVLIHGGHKDSWNYYTLDCGHECMVSHAAELAHILLEQD